MITDFNLRENFEFHVYAYSHIHEDGAHNKNYFCDEHLAGSFKFEENCYGMLMLEGMIEKDSRDSTRPDVDEEGNKLESYSVGEETIYVRNESDKSPLYLLSWDKKFLLLIDRFEVKNDLQGSSLQDSDRNRIVHQILRAFEYIHSKGILHRDVSPRNILIKEYEDTKVIKVADFGLVKAQESHLTSLNTELKGCFNDPGLATEGFSNYRIVHETYALTKLIYFVMTGKTNTANISNHKLRCFVEKGLSVNKEERYQSIAALRAAFKSL